MLPTLNYKQILRRVVFPVYVLSSEDIYYEDGLLRRNNKVIDDKNQMGDTIGKRRLQTEHALAALGKACFTFIEMMDSKTNLFIDSNGKPFRYKKEKLLPIKSYKINKKIPMDTYTVLYIKKVNFLYRVPRYPHSEEWAQIILYDKLPWMLYSLSDEEVPTFRRKI